MRFVRPENKCVILFNGMLTFFIARDSRSGDNLIKFPLRAVTMIRISCFARRNSANFDVERMALVQIS